MTGELTAKIYSNQIGKEIRYVGDDLGVWAEKSKGIIPEFRIADMRIMYQFFQDKGMIAIMEDIEFAETLLVHKLRSFDDFVNALATEWRHKALKAA